MHIKHRLTDDLPHGSLTQSDSIKFFLDRSKAAQIVSPYVFFFNTGSSHSDNKLPTAAAHSLPALLGTNTNSPPHQMEAAVIETLSSATVLCKTQQCTHTTTERAC